VKEDLMRMHYLVSILVLAGLMLIVGCGDDDGGGPTTVTGVEITPSKDQLELGHETEITATVSGGDSKTLTWYVNDIENGNAQWGTVTQNSPVTYTAPDLLPYPATVEIKAVSTENESKADSCEIQLKFTKIFVDADNGDDDDGTGCINQPFKSITHGLGIAQSGMTVLAQPGVYDQDNGEEFAIRVPEGISLVGMDWESCIIRGHWDIGYEESVTLVGTGPVFRKFTVEQGLPVEPECDIAIHLQAKSGLVDSIRVQERADYSICRFTNTEDMVIQNCYFVIDDGETLDRAFEFSKWNYGAVIRNVEMTGFSQAMNIGGKTDVMIEYCSIIDCAQGIRTCCDNDTAHVAVPDLGGGPRDSAGGNVFSGYTNFALVNGTAETIYAKGNTWENIIPVEGVDYENNYGGEVITQ
jgi:hypothetical protein